MNPQFNKIGPLSLRRCLKRPRSESFRESDQQQFQHNNQIDRANPSQKRLKSNLRHVQWDKSMPDITNSGQRVQRADGRGDIKMTNIFHKGQQVEPPHRQQQVKMTDVLHRHDHAQWPHRQWDVKMKDVSHKSRHTQWPHRQGDVKMTDVSRRGQHVQWPHTQRDVKMKDVSYSQSRSRPFQREGTIALYDQGKGQNVQRGAGTTLYNHRRAQHVQPTARMAFHGHGSAQQAQRDQTTIDTNTNVNDRKDPLGPVQETHCKPLLAQIYADIHAASVPGAIQATTDLTQLALLEGGQFSVQNWIQCNAAIQTRSNFKVIGKQRLPSSLYR